MRHATLPWRLAGILSAILLLFPIAGRAQIDTERTMVVARNALAFEDYLLSISYFNLVINYKPHNYEPYYYRGIAKFCLDDYTGAALDCSEAIRRNPYFPNSYELRALAYIHTEDYTHAIDDYTTVTAMQPDQRPLWHNLALCLIATDSLDRADSIASFIVRKWPNLADGHHLKAQIYLQRQDTLSAEQAIDQALLADRNSLAALTAKGHILMNRQDHAGALPLFNRALRIDARNAPLLTSRALCHYHLDNYRAAMADYDQALIIQPRNFAAHYNRGLLRAEVGEDNLAIEDFNFVLSIDPDDMMATFNRARLLENTGDIHGAIRDYTTVIREYPKFLYGYERRAAALRKIGENARAMRDEEHVLKEQIAQRYGYSTPTSRLKNKTRRPSSVNLDDYQKLIEQEDSTQQIVYESPFRGKIQNKDQEARLQPLDSQILRVYEEAKQTHVTNTFQQALQQAEDGHIHEAIALFTQVLEYNDALAQVYFNRGLLYLLLDDTSHAIPDLSKAGELGIPAAYSLIKKNQRKLIPTP